MDPILNILSDTIPKARTLEELTRPLLVMLSQVAGMESTYLTTINLSAGTQRVVYAHNTGEMIIPEGLEVGWSDTLCKRALEENRMCTTDVAECWGDSDAAAALGIKTYVTSPIRAQNGDLLGTLCAASAHTVPNVMSAEPLLRLLSGLVSYSLERELLVERLQMTNQELARLALTDPLTGLPNRRAVLNDLARMSDIGQREGKSVLVGVIDMDGFKQINDTFGHLAGDEFLCAVSQRLKDVLRSSDIIGRTGGDEFIVVALGAPAGAGGEQQHAASLLQERLSQASAGMFNLPVTGIELDYAGASVGVASLIPGSMSADDVIKLADHEMYKVKVQRKSLHC